MAEAGSRQRFWDSGALAGIRWRDDPESDPHTVVLFQQLREDGQPLEGTRISDGGATVGTVSWTYDDAGRLAGELWVQGDTPTLTRYSWGCWEDRP